jgi:SAM-dependent methyltransferase
MTPDTTTLDIATLARTIAANRFLPVPPAEQWFVGDGDFRAIGAEFLRHFVEFGDLGRTARVLEIGCGIGRMALPLTQYLDPAAGSYDGIDVVRDGIDWCGQTLTPVYPNFRFHHRDYVNDVYNPAGALEAAREPLPFSDRSFDFVLLTSVITHLRTADTVAYAKEIGRVVKPGGRCFLSLFLMTDAARTGLRADRRRLSFDPGGAGPEFLADPEHPAAAVAYDEAFLLDVFGAAGLRPARAPAYGHWATGEGASYQDLCLFEKETAR